MEERVAILEERVEAQRKELADLKRQLDDRQAKDITYSMRVKLEGLDELVSLLKMSDPNQGQVF